MLSSEKFLRFKFENVIRRSSKWHYKLTNLQYRTGGCIFFILLCTSEHILIHQFIAPWDFYDRNKEYISSLRINFSKSFVYFNFTCVNDSCNLRISLKKRVPLPHFVTLFLLMEFYFIVSLHYHYFSKFLTFGLIIEYSLKFKDGNNLESRTNEEHEKEKTIEQWENIMSSSSRQISRSLDVEST